MMQPSPVKAAKVTKPSRQQRSDDILNEGVGLMDNFYELHVKKPPVLQPERTESIESLVTRLRQPMAADVYKCLCDLLNTISNEIYATLPQHNHEKLVFIDHHTSPLSHHPDKGIVDKPDVVAVLSSYINQLGPQPEGWYNRIPWHRSHSPVEWKRPSDPSGLPQVLAYATAHTRARPDNPGVYALSASRSGYNLVWSDPAGHASGMFHWSNIQPLIGYVYSLYSPPDDHNLHDPSITLEPSDFYDPPKWRIQFNDVTYSDCETIWVGPAGSRMTWVARSMNNPGKVIKDSYRSVRRTYRESELINQIHASGRAGGWVVCIDSSQVERHGNPIQTPLEHTRRVKQRLVMDGSGETLYQCRSIFHFLKVMYDVLEAHRWAADKRKVLHRDLSINNILVNPELSPFEPPDDRPKFIEEILEGRKNAPSLALLCDLDNGSTFDPSIVIQRRSVALSDSEANIGSTSSLEKNQDMKDRTGTPLFISRSVCVSSVLTGDFPRFVSMPVLATEPASLYNQVHALDQFRKYQDAGCTHGGSFDDPLYGRIAESDTLAKSLFCPQPRHDAESVFWIIVLFLLRALPADPTTKDNLKPLQQLWRSLGEHHIPESTDGYIDSREGVLKYSVKKWRPNLHPDLADEAELLGQLCEQVNPEYAYLVPQPPLFHLHEAMQRILLDHLWAMSKAERHIDLHQTQLREVYTVTHTKQFLTKTPTPGTTG